MYAGKVVETTDDRRRSTPTRATRTPRRCSMRCRRSRRRPGERLYSIPGAPPDLVHPPTGCRFAPRCRYADRPLPDRGPGAGRRDDRAHLRLLLPGRRAGEDRGRPARGGRAAWRTRAPAAEIAVVGELVLSAKNLVKDFPVTKGACCSAGRHGERGRRRVVRHPQGRDARPGRRVRLRQDHHRPDARRPGQADRAASIRFGGKDLARVSGREYRRERRDIQYMFQDSYASLDPRMRAGSILREPLIVQGMGSRERAAGQGQGDARPGRAAARRGPSGTRTSSPAGSGSGSASPAR